MRWADDKTKAIYEELCKLRDTGNLKHLQNAHSLCNICSDPVYQFYMDLLKKNESGERLILYGLGSRIDSYIQLERERRDTVGYLWIPFLGDIPWYGVYDKDPEKVGRDDWNRLSWEQLYEVRDKALVCVGALDFYDEIKEELIKADFDENRIIKYVFPWTECYEEKQYYDDFLRARREGVMIDGGCFRCDTIERFIEWNKEYGYDKIISFEPDRTNYEICQKIIEDNQWHNVELIHAGLSDKKMECSVVANGNDTSFCVEDGSGAERVNMVKIDDIISQQDSKCSFIKLDVEGYELQALKGAENTIKNSLPTLAVSLYHKMSDLGLIPEYIQSLSAKYKFYIRIYSNAYLEIVLYAIAC